MALWVSNEPPSMAFSINSNSIVSVGVGVDLIAACTMYLFQPLTPSPWSCPSAKMYLLLKVDAAKIHEQAYPETTL